MEPLRPVREGDWSSPDVTPRAPTSIRVLGVLALLYTLYFARAFLLPIAFAVLFNFLLSPAVRALARFGIRPPVAAGILVLATVASISLSAVALARPVQQWVARAPATFHCSCTRPATSRALARADPLESTTASVPSATRPLGPIPMNSRGKRYHGGRDSSKGEQLALTRRSPPRR